MTAPEVPSCADCHKWMYQDNWQPTPSRKEGERYMPRPKGMRTPCWKCPKGPTPFEKELTPKNERAYGYYKLCSVDSTGLLPRDLITIKNNSLIADVEKQIDRSRSDLSPILLALMGKK